MKTTVKAALAFFLGVVSAPYLIWCWAQIAAHGLIFDPALALGLHGSLLYAVLSVADFIASLVILSPLALAVRSLGNLRLAPHTGLALLGLFCASAIIGGLPLWPNSWQLLVANLSPYLALCVAVFLCSVFIRRTPNNSFKPKPLRGSA